MGKVWVKIHLDVRPGEEEMEINAATGRRIQDMMDILYSDIMKRGDTMIIRVTDDDRAYVFYERASDGKIMPYVKVNHVFSINRDSGRLPLLCALGNATDRLDPNIRGLIYSNPEAIRYLLDETAGKVAEKDPEDIYVKQVAELQEKTDAEVISAIKSVTFFVKKIKLNEHGEEIDSELDTDELPAAK